MLKNTLTLFFLFLSISAFSQKLTFVQGEVIVQFHSTVESIQPTLKRLDRIGGRKSKVKAQKCLSESMNIWTLKFDHTTISEDKFIKIIQSDRLVQVAQLNHLIAYRNIPNDTEFTEQWQYINDGAENGTVGADLDADLAWDITTGGVTPNGDTIVLAALDDGVDLDHIDLRENIWKNHNEIPNNGIDDDNNGYIDDVNGWNVVAGNGDLNGGSHGTPVMGIMGAKGNNGIGVTGVNWDVKVMMIQTEFFTDEATLIEGYGYPLAMRKLYNETNGEQGAFVVATNSSWGVDKGQADDSPIWCSLYDSLGLVGILNCGATANENFNVDEIGDLPTTCVSDYLIGVTNLNRKGEKEEFAGFGQRHIDLGAFGEETYTLNRNDSYAPFGGTSGATPHVTGAIGLLYAAPCGNFSNLAKTNPAAAALLAKEYILSGAKPNVTLDMITVTGGQLNLNNSLQILIGDCGPCPPPVRIAFSEIIDVATTVEWISSKEELTANLRYRVLGTSDWLEVANVVSPYVISGLTECTDYEFQIKSDCAEESSGYNRIYKFKTEGCCIPPLNVRVNGTSSDQLSIEWDALFAARSYEIRLVEVGGEGVQMKSTTNTTITFDGLNSCTNYEFQVRTICATMTTDFSPIQIAITRGCGSCTDLEYCETTGDGQFEWITRVELNTLVNESSSDLGYGDYTGITTDLNAFQTYDFKINLGYQSFPFDENLQVWIDFNQDGVFDEETENVVDVDTDFTDELATQITIPGDAVAGLTRMRVAMKWREGPNPDKASPCLTYDFGEVEDYCVNIIQEANPCFPTSSIALLDAPLDSVAFLAWEAGFGALSYNYRYRVQGETNWIEGVSDNGELLFLGGLSKCNAYEIQVQSVCDSMKLSDFSDSFVFNTNCPCLPPSNIRVVDSTLSTISVEWDAIDFADKYEVVYKTLDNSTSRRTIVSTNKAQLFALTKCTGYAVTVRGFCSETNGETSTAIIANTDCTDAVTTVPTDVDKLSVYPNPFRDILTVEIDLKRQSDLQLKLYDVSGKLIQSRSLDKVNVGLQQITLDYATLGDGMYLLSIETDEGKTVRRVVKL